MVKKHTINGGKKRGRPKKKKDKKDKRTHSKPKKKQNKNTQKKCKPCVKKMSQKIDDIIDDIESIKRKNDHDEIDDLLLNSIDDLHKVYRLFKKIEDPKKELLEDEPLDLSDEDDDTDDDADYHVDAFKEQFESPSIEEPEAEEPEEPEAEEPEEPEGLEEPGEPEEPEEPEEPTPEDTVGESNLDVLEEPLVEENSSITLDDAEQNMFEGPVKEDLPDDFSDLSDDISDLGDEKEEIKESPNIMAGGKMKLQNILNELNNN
jgi:hypothetical protein